MRHSNFPSSLRSISNWSSIFSEVTDRTKPWRSLLSRLDLSKTFLDSPACGDKPGRIINKRTAEYCINFLLRSIGITTLPFLWIWGSLNLGSKSCAKLVRICLTYWNLVDIIKSNARRKLEECQIFIRPIIFFLTRDNNKTWKVP